MKEVRWGCVQEKLIECPFDEWGGVYKYTPICLGTSFEFFAFGSKRTDHEPCSCEKWTWFKARVIVGFIYAS